MRPLRFALFVILVAGLTSGAGYLWAPLVAPKVESFHLSAPSIPSRIIEPPLRIRPVDLLVPSTRRLLPAHLAGSVHVVARRLVPAPAAPRAQVAVAAPAKPAASPPPVAVPAVHHPAAPKFTVAAPKAGAPVTPAVEVPAPAHEPPPAPAPAPSPVPAPVVSQPTLPAVVVPAPVPAPAPSPSVSNPPAVVTPV
jgi:hypothetical protein